MSWQEKPMLDRDADFLFTWDEVDASLTDMAEALTNIDQLSQDHPLRTAYLELLDVNMSGAVILPDIEIASRSDGVTKQFFRPELGRKSHFPNYQNIMRLAVVKEIIKGVVGFRISEEAKEDGAAKLESLSLSLDRANGIVFGSDFVKSSRQRVDEDVNEAEITMITHAAQGRGQAAFTDSDEYYEVYDFINDLTEAVNQYET